MEGILAPSPEQSAVAVLLIGFVFGLYHAIEADHLAAVSAIVSEHRNVLTASIIGGFWGLGHTISLFVFRADGLPWPSQGLQRVGGAQARVTTSRGFTSVLWRDGELGYALVSDVEPADLVRLAERLAPGA